MEFQRKKKTKPDKLTRRLCFLILLRKYKGDSDFAPKILALSPYVSQQGQEKTYPFPNKIKFDYEDYCCYFNISFSTFARDLEDLKFSNYITWSRKYRTYYNFCHSNEDIFKEEDPRLYRIFQMYLDHYDAIDAYIDKATNTFYDCPTGRFLLRNIDDYKKLTAASFISSNLSPGNLRKMQRDFKVLKTAAELIRLWAGK